MPKTKQTPVQRANARAKEYQSAVAVERERAAKLDKRLGESFLEIQSLKSEIKKLKKAANRG